MGPVAEEGGESDAEDGAVEPAGGGGRGHMIDRQRVV